jgi:ABC-type Mn2+/Zn2+ transport system permease subunit
MSWLTEPLSYDFMQRALAAGLLAVLTTSVVGTWVVLRRLAFMGDALAHGVLPGIAVAFLLGLNLALGAAVAAAVMVAAIALVHRTSRLSEDTAIGLLFVGMLALGVVIISRSGSFAVDLVAILFGDVLGTTGSDLVLQAVAAAVAVVGAVVFYRPLMALSFNEQKAATLGMWPGAAHLVMMSLITLAVVASFQAVGALLVFGLLVAPPATAVLVARRVPTVMATAVLLGSIEVVGGLLISYHFDTAAGATMSGLSVVVFFLVLAATRLRSSLGSSRVAEADVGVSLRGR